MGRPLKEIDTEKLLQMAENEMTNSDMADILGVSAPTLKSRIDMLRSQQGILLDSKSVDNLRVIRIKEKVLTKIEGQLHMMEVDDLIKSLNVLNKMDTPVTDDGKLKGIFGLLTAVDEEAERRADEKVEERELEKKTLDITPKSTQFPKL